MTRRAFEAIHKVKSADVDEKAHSLSVLQGQIDALNTLLEKTTAQMGDGLNDATCAATMMAATRWHGAQILRRDRLMASIAQQTKTLEARQDALRAALSERRAIERLLSKG